MKRTSPCSRVRRPSGEVIAFSRAFLATSAAFGLSDCAAFRERVPSSPSSRFQAQWPVSWSTSVMVRPSSPSSTLTSVTEPPSSSGFSSISWKMRDAPASAIITMLNCMETWPSGLTKERDRVSREMRAPRVSLPAPARPKLPMPPTTGMVTLPQVFASAEAWNSSSFVSSKVFWVASSWLKTLMTF